MVHESSKFEAHDFQGIMVRDPDIIVLHESDRGLK